MMSYIFGSASKHNTSDMKKDIFDEPPDTHVVFGSGQYHRRHANIRLQEIVNQHIDEYHAQ